MKSYRTLPIIVLAIVMICQGVLLVAQNERMARIEKQRDKAIDGWSECLGIMPSEPYHPPTWGHDNLDKPHCLATDSGIQCQGGLSL